MIRRIDREIQMRYLHEVDCMFSGSWEKIFGVTLNMGKKTKQKKYHQSVPLRSTYLVHQYGTVCYPQLKQSGRTRRWPISTCLAFGPKTWRQPRCQSWVMTFDHFSSGGVFYLGVLQKMFCISCVAVLTYRIWCWDGCIWNLSKMTWMSYWNILCLTMRGV